MTLLIVSMEKQSSQLWISFEHTFRFQWLKRAFQKTAVSTQLGIIEFVVTPFCEMNATQTLQRCMDTVFRDLDFVYCYIDDIIMSESP
jgi:hypothetical protein